MTAVQQLEPLLGSIARQILIQVLPITCLGALLSACNLPGMRSGRGADGKQVVETIAVLQTSLASTEASVPTAAPPSPTSLAPLPSVATLAPLPTAVDPVVAITSLCWTGPGTAYPVVSAIQLGAEVEVLGVGSKEGWIVITNPTYGDRCWIEAKNLTLDPNFSSAGLQVFNPPPTPGPKVTPSPTPT